MNDGRVRSKIAVIDDDPAMLTVITTALETKHDVTAYADPREALAAFQNGFVPDVIVCDVMMPYMTGFDLHLQVREIPVLVPVPFLFLTSMSDRSHQRQGMKQGADDYITKPFELDELRSAVSARIERTESLRAGEGGSLIVTSLGGAGLVHGNRRVQWEAGNVLVLLLYLLHNGKSVPVREVRGELWSEPVQENSVRVLINRARNMLDGVGEIGVQDEVLQLHLERPVVWDARLFELAAGAALKELRAGRIEASLKMYTGEFLPAMEAPWLEQQRAFYENLYCELLEAAIGAAGNEVERAAATARLEAYYRI